jgi:uncharacterized repeat protein (TIGR01451 family)
VNRSATNLVARMSATFRGPRSSSICGLRWQAQRDTALDFAAPYGSTKSPSRVQSSGALQRVSLKIGLVSILILMASNLAFGATNIYQIRGTPDLDIYQLNPLTGVLSNVYLNYPGGSSATIAQRPSDGMLFYSINATDGQVYRFNPATPNIAPVALTNTLGATVPSSFRMAFSPAGVLYYLPDTGRLYTINQTTGVATAGPTITGLDSGGDMAFSPAGTLYVINSDRELYTCPIGGGAATFLGNVTFPGGITPASLGLAFDGSGALRVQTQNPSRSYTVTLPSLAATTPVTLGGGTTATGDLASATVPDPNLSITKTSAATSVYQGGPVTYTITVSNLTAAYAVTGTVVDTLPATVTGVTWTCAASAGSTCTNASGAGNSINTSATLLPSGTATYTVTGTVSTTATGTLSNTATVAVPSLLLDSNTANNTATENDPININANLSVTKTDGLANINPGSPITYTIVVASAATSTGPANGAIVTDTVPASITGVTWTCGSPTLGATCGAPSGSGNSINTTANLPVGSSLTYTVSGTLSVTATGTLSNTAMIITPASGVSDPTDLGRTGAGNNSATDTTTIVLVSDLTIAKSHTGNFTQGQVGATYSLTITNSGSAVTSGVVTVVDTLPAGLTATAISGTGWTCVLGTLTCTRSDALAAAASYPVITVTVNVANNAAASVTNSVAVSGGGESNVSNNTATDPTTINQLPDLTIVKSHTGNFTQGQVGAVYSVTVTNSGFASTSGVVSVTDTLPVGLTATAISGTGWTCVLGTLTCTRSDALAAAASYPVITVTVNVANNAAASVTNTANVSGGGQVNTANDSAADPTTINQLPDLTVAKSHTGNFTQGQVGATYSVTVTNSGFASTSGVVTMADTLPAGLTATAISGTGWTCVLGTLTCTRSDALAAAASYPVITVTVNVANNAAASVTNTANVSGGGQTNTTNDSATDPTTINQLPDLTIAKSHTGNFTQGQVGATYSLTVTNSGLASTSAIATVTDTLPAGLTATAISGTGWTCVLGTLTCTRNTVLAAGASYPVITVTVNVANNAAASVTNTANVSGGGQTNTANDSASDPTTINQLPDLTIAKSHTGNFTQGQVGATYSLTVTNSGFASTSGVVTVTDTLPAGLTASAISGTGWTCVLGTLTCTRNTVLAVGASYPVITVTVNVSNNAAASVTNSVTVSGGGESNASNNTATDPTTVNQLPDLTIAKSHTGNFTQGQVGATYSITVTNSGFASTSGVVTVTDTLPVGLTATAISGTGWTCVLGTLTCTRNTVLAVGASYPVITVTVNVSLSAPTSVTNSVTVSGGGESNVSNNAANDPTTINAAAPPNIGLVKSVVPSGAQVPGTDLTYTIVYTNSGGQPATNFVVVDPNMANADPLERVFHNVDFKVLTMASNPGTTGLVAAFEYSNNGGATWTYTPVSAGGGAPAGYDRNVTNVRWSFTGSLSHLAPNNSGNVSFTVRIR